jgi:toxin HigB-1
MFSVADASAAINYYQLEARLGIAVAGDDPSAKRVQSFIIGQAMPPARSVQAARQLAVKCHLTNDAVKPMLLDVQIDSIRHKPLRQFVETGKPKGLNANVADRLRNMIAYLAAIDAVDELLIPPNWGAHQLTGDRAGIWSLTVTKNWRMTFRISGDGTIVDLDLEDYH